MRVLIVEDEELLAESVRDGLKYEAIAADIAPTGELALELLTINEYDAVVLDRDLPGISGDDVARQITADRRNVPILMLTAARSLAAKELGFESGADDYLTKPFERRELVLRLKALHRRRSAKQATVHEIAGIKIDTFRREVFRDGKYISLTKKQFAVLAILVEAKGGVVSAEELLEKAWDMNTDPFTNAVRVTLSGLRKRLGEPWVISTVAGVGYRIETTPNAAELEGAA